jgi:hypothetical protein
MLKLEFSSLFGSRVACKLTRANLLTKRAKTIARFIKKMIELNNERVEPTHEFLTHGPTPATTELTARPAPAIAITFPFPSFFPFQFNSFFKHVSIQF